MQFFTRLAIFHRICSKTKYTFFLNSAYLYLWTSYKSLYSETKQSNRCWMYW